MPSQTTSRLPASLPGGVRQAGKERYWQLRGHSGGKPRSAISLALPNGADMHGGKMLPAVLKHHVARKPGTGGARKGPVDLLRPVSLLTIPDVAPICQGTHTKFLGSAALWVRDRSRAYVTGCSGGSPCSERATSATAISAIRRDDSLVMPAIWGDKSTFGAVRIGLPRGGSSSKTSSAAPAS